MGNADYTSRIGIEHGNMLKLKELFVNLT